MATENNNEWTMVSKKVSNKSKRVTQNSIKISNKIKGTSDSKHCTGFYKKENKKLIYSEFFVNFYEKISIKNNMKQNIEGIIQELIGEFDIETKKEKVTPTPREEEWICCVPKGNQLPQLPNTIGSYQFKRVVYCNTRPKKGYINIQLEYHSKTQDCEFFKVNIHFETENNLSECTNPVAYIKSLTNLNYVSEMELISKKINTRVLFLSTSLPVGFRVTKKFQNTKAQQRLN